MRESLDALIKKPTVEDIIDAVGPLVNAAPGVGRAERGERRRGRRGE
jgi:hypothetical protein